MALSHTNIHALQHAVCDVCRKPLETLHAYPLSNPAEVISLCVQTGPMHPTCADNWSDVFERLSEVPPTPHVRAIALVPGGSTLSGKIIRMVAADPESLAIRLFRPDTVRFLHITPHGPATVQRRATNQEVFHWMQPAIEAAMRQAQGDTDETHELTLTLGMIQKRWINKPDSKPASSANPA